MDALLTWDNETGEADISIADGDLVTTPSLESAVLISLFCDGRARADDSIPDGSSDRRGAWFDAIDQEPIGSRLWLLARSKIAADLPTTIETYARDSLQWIVRDGLANRIDIDAERIGLDRIGLAVVVTLPRGSALQPSDRRVVIDNLDIDIVISASDALHTTVHSEMPL